MKGFWDPEELPQTDVGSDAGSAEEEIRRRAGDPLPDWSSRILTALASLAVDPRRGYVGRTSIGALDSAIGSASGGIARRVRSLLVQEGREEDVRRILRAYEETTRRRNRGRGFGGGDRALAIAAWDLIDESWRRVLWGWDAFEDPFGEPLPRWRVRTLGAEDFVQRVDRLLVEELEFLASQVAHGRSRRRVVDSMRDAPELALDADHLRAWVSARLMRRAQALRTAQSSSVPAPDVLIRFLDALDDAREPVLDAALVMVAEQTAASDDLRTLRQPWDSLERHAPAL